MSEIGEGSNHTAGKADGTYAKQSGCPVCRLGCAADLVDENKHNDPANDQRCGPQIYEGLRAGGQKETPGKNDG